MARFEIRTGVRQRGLGPPAWRRALGLTILLLSALAVLLFTLELR
jgi:hypothetical protein